MPLTPADRLAEDSRIIDRWLANHRYSLDYFDQLKADVRYLIRSGSNSDWDRRTVRALFRFAISQGDTISTSETTLAGSRARAEASAPRPAYSAVLRTPRRSPGTQRVQSLPNPTSTVAPTTPSVVDSLTEMARQFDYTVMTELLPTRRATFP